MVVSTKTTQPFVTMVTVAHTTIHVREQLASELPTVAKMATSAVMTIASAMVLAPTHRISSPATMATTAPRMTSVPTWPVQEPPTVAMMTMFVPMILATVTEHAQTRTTQWPVMTGKAAPQMMSVWTEPAWEVRTPATMMAMCVPMSFATVTEPAPL